MGETLHSTRRRLDLFIGLMTVSTSRVPSNNFLGISSDFPTNNQHRLYTTQPVKIGAQALEVSRDSREEWVSASRAIRKDDSLRYSLSPSNVVSEKLGWRGGRRCQCGIERTGRAARQICEGEVRCLPIPCVVVQSISQGNCSLKISGRGGEAAG